MNHGSLVIREAALADAAGIAVVHIDSWRTTYRGMVPQAYLDSLDYDERTVRWNRILSESAATHAVHVAEDRQVGIVGFASGGPERSGDSEYRGELYAIYVQPQYQRKGLGVQLTGAIVDSLVRFDLHSMLVWVLTDNQQARMFYERLGGQYLSTQPIEVGGISLDEVAYGWPDIGVLQRRLKRTALQER